MICWTTTTVKRDPVAARLAELALVLDGPEQPAVPDPEALEQMVAEWGAIGRREMAALLLTRLSELQLQARRRGDLATALRALDAIAKVAGLTP
jgi:hypothetical protein